MEKLNHIITNIDKNILMDNNIILYNIVDETNLIIIFGKDNYLIYENTI